MPITHTAWPPPFSEGLGIVDKGSEKAPDYRVLAGVTKFGAAWKKTSKADRAYISVKLDDPSFPQPIYATLVPAYDGETMNLIWSRWAGAPPRKAGRTHLPQRADQPPCPSCPGCPS